MDSYSLYREYCKNAMMVSGKERLQYVENLVCCIEKEIFTESNNVENSSFIRAVVDMINSKTSRQNEFVSRLKSDISIVDAYVILEILLSYVQEEREGILDRYRSYSSYLFCGKSFWGNAQEEINKMIHIVREIIKITNKRTEEKAAQLQMKELADAQEQELQEEMFEQGEVHEQEDVQENVQENPVVSMNSAIDKKRNELLAERLKNNKEHVQKWHEEMKSTQEAIIQLQPSVSKVLEGFMSFSDRITQNYILQFAKQQVELYDLISDNYLYHKEKAEERGNEDYQNAVMNYEDFLCTIADGLASFGVEEIVSEEGQLFDGKIHEVARKDFSSRTAMVQKSIRSGFRYKDIIIQKEKVMV